MGMMHGKRSHASAGGARPAALLAMMGVLALTGCPAQDRPGDGQGGTVVIGARSDFAGFNSITNTAQYTDELIKYALFTPLLQYDPDLDMQPHLAESWELEGDTAVVLTLRDDVFWHDGEPVTAEDVKFTFDMAKNPETASLLGEAYLTDVARAEVLEPHRIRFAFVRPHAQALENFWWAPMPRHLLGDVSATEMRNAPFNRQPVGSGPYRFVEWRSNERLVLEPNPDYPEALGGPPAAERVVIRIIPEAATLLTELITGNVHVSIDVEPHQVRDVERNQGLELHSFPGRAVYFIAWNTRREPFTSPEVRRAMTMAINRQEIIDALLFGHGRPASSPVPPWSPYAPDVEPLPFDREEAARLLEEAGWVDRDGDGVREDAAGNRLSFTLLTSDRALNRSIVEVVQSQLRQVGARVELQVSEFQTMLSQFRGREYDAALANWVLDNFQVATAPRSLFHSENAALEGSANRTSYSNPEADALIERGGLAADPGEARRTWEDFTRLLQRDQPVTFMFWLDELAASRQEVRGLEMDPRGEYRGIAEWTVR